MKPFDIDKVMKILEQMVLQWRTPAVTIVSQREGNPFKVLISCILSLRTKDETTGPASERLFAIADTPQKLSKLPVELIEKTIFPVGFYRNKATQIKNISIELVEKYNSIVPGSLDELLKFKGVGRKTANLVITLGFGKPGICVDTHVHRICNRFGYVKTKNPEETEFALRAKLPEKYWIRINDLLVTLGQNRCKPISPICSSCQLVDYCKKEGVDKHR
ncbi:MAG: endonuclease III [Desulfuromonadales bacterium]|nr:endonuclease III [Desulfuromonadales bacterium]